MLLQDTSRSPAFPRSVDLEMGAGTEGDNSIWSVERQFCREDAGISKEEDHKPIGGSKRGLGISPL